MKQLDFIIIGAQKAGTTSLFKYLEHHPQIGMPKEKEAPFFCFDERFEKGWEWFIQEFFSTIPKQLFWGKATPAYMSYPIPSAQRISDLIPQVKLIAILRNPVHRAFSHYKMCVKRGVETRNFHQAVLESLESTALEKARQLNFNPSNNKNAEKFCYLIRGEYGRILSIYLNSFLRDNLLVLFMEDLEKKPRETFQSVCHFLNIDKTYIPSNIDKKYHVGGTKKRFSRPRFINHNLIRWFWYKIPQKKRRSLRYWLNQMNTMKNESLIINNETQQLLIEFYKSDIKLLRETLDIIIPWPEFKRM